MASIDINVVKSVASSLDLSSGDYNTFIETGTFYGDTAANLSSHMNSVYTIELSTEYYHNFCQRVVNEQLRNVKPYFGDSAVVLPTLLQSLDQSDSVVFWLDGHWSSGNTAKGPKDCPLVEECLAIDNNYKAHSGLVMIDDLRLFGTKANEDWSDISIDAIHACFSNYTVTRSAVHHDVLALFIERS